jgi:hypothetical protein
MMDREEGARHMTSRRFVTTAAALLAMAAGLYAQTTTSAPAGKPTVKTEQLKGEVVWVDHDLLVAKLPNDTYRVFNMKPGQQFNIDGQTKLIGELKMGTVLTATATTTTQPVTVRTATTLTGTVVWASGNYVVLALPTGEDKGYTVPESFRFNVEGKPASVHDLKAGMKVTATKIVEDPQTVISTTTVITGKAPK